MSAMLLTATPKALPDMSVYGKPSDLDRSFQYPYSSHGQV